MGHQIGIEIEIPFVLIIIIAHFLIRNNRFPLHHDAYSDDHEEYFP